ncbi:hypothetical protein ACFXPV_23345 [Streptomyces sp. NPDC059118]|uniref:hypothetical protein n=1 Tax=unclassified Streptomyces TaxID=2593676 RepID=UPI00369D0A6C
MVVHGYRLAVGHEPPCSALAALDTWLKQGYQRRIPQKYLPADSTTRLTMNPQVKDMISVAGNVSVKYKETARGGLAVNIIEC